MKYRTIGKLETTEPALKAGRGSVPKEATRTGKWPGTTAHAVVPSRNGMPVKLGYPARVLTCLASLRSNGSSETECLYKTCIEGMTVAGNHELAPNRITSEAI